MEVIWGIAIFTFAILMSSGISHMMECYYRGCFDRKERIVRNACIRGREYSHYYKEEEWSNPGERERILTQLLLKEHGFYADHWTLEGYRQKFLEEK